MYVYLHMDEFKRTLPDTQIQRFILISLVPDRRQQKVVVNVWAGKIADVVVGDNGFHKG
jgi:hypothetical protein